MTERVQFQYPHDPDADDDVALAIFSAECVYGRPRTRLEVNWEPGADGRSCELTTNGAAGEAAVRILIGLFTARFGDDHFTVTRVGQ